MYFQHHQFGPHGSAEEQYVGNTGDFGTSTICRHPLRKSLVPAQSQRAPFPKHLDCGRLQGISQSSQSQQFRLFPSFEVLVCFLPKVKFSASCRRIWRVSRRRVRKL